MTGQSDRLNVLATAIDTDDTAIVFTYENRGAGDGSIITIGIEEMAVVDVSTTGAITTLTVIRGFNSSVPAAHAVGDIIYINPQFSSFRISQFVNQAFYNLSAEGLFRMINTTLAANSLLLGYDLGSLDDYISMWRVRYSISGSSQAWPQLRQDEFYVDRDADTTSFPSGSALFLREGVMSGQTLNVSYRASFNKCVALNDDVATITGLYEEAHDLPPLDAAIAILSGREVKRSFLNRQPEPRRQEEVPAGAANQSMAPFIKRYEDRVIQERLRLKRLYPGGV
jgi:hypothetical protein